MSSYALGRTHALDYLYNMSLDTALEYMRALTAEHAAPLARDLRVGRKHRAYVRAYVDTLLAELSA